MNDKIKENKTKQIIDYINNLQHIEDLYNQLLKDYDELQQENELLRRKLKEYDK